MRATTSMLNRSFVRKVGLFACAASIIWTLTGVMRQSWTGANVLESEACAQSRFPAQSRFAGTPPFKCVNFPCGTKWCCNNTLHDTQVCCGSRSPICCTGPSGNTFCCRKGQGCSDSGCL